MFYAPYKIFLFIVSYFKLTRILYIFFQTEEKLLSNHWKTFVEIFFLQQIFIPV